MPCMFFLEKKSKVPQTPDSMTQPLPTSDVDRYFSTCFPQIWGRDRTREDGMTLACWLSFSSCPAMSYERASRKEDTYQ